MMVQLDPGTELGEVQGMRIWMVSVSVESELSPLQGCSDSPRPLPTGPLASAVIL